MKCDSRVEKSCLSFEEFLECPFSGKYLACCSEAKHLEPPSSLQLEQRMLNLRVKIFLYIADFFRLITMNEEIVELVVKEESNSDLKKVKQPRHIYQKFSASTTPQISKSTNNRPI